MAVSFCIVQGFFAPALVTSFTFLYTRRGCNRYIILPSNLYTYPALPNNALQRTRRSYATQNTRSTHHRFTTRAKAFAVFPPTKQTNSILRLPISSRARIAPVSTHSHHNHDRPNVRHAHPSPLPPLPPQHNASPLQTHRTHHPCHQRRYHCGPEQQWQGRSTHHQRPPPPERRCHRIALQRLLPRHPPHQRLGTQGPCILAGAAHPPRSRHYRPQASISQRCRGAAPQGPLEGAGSLYRIHAAHA